MRVFKILVPAGILALFVAELLLVFGCYIFAVYIDGVHPLDLFLLDEFGVLRISVVVVSILAGLYFQDLYGDVRVRSRILLLQQICIVIGIAFSLQALISYWSADWTVPSMPMIIGSALALAALFISRVLFSPSVQRGIGLRRVLFVGISPTILRLAGYFREHPEFGLTPVGYLEGDGERYSPAPAIACLGDMSNFERIVETTQPDWIVVQRREEIPPAWIEELLEFRYVGVRAEEAAKVYEIAFGRVCSAEIRPSAVIFEKALQPQAVTVRLQSLYSLMLALLLTIITLPLMVLTAIIIRLTSAGPVFMRHRRVGLDSAVFNQYRFRCTRESSGGGGLTYVGRLLRRSHLDALPQLFNVLRGEMSIFGPRPERPEFAERLSELIPFYRQREIVKPGVTGWAQVNDGGQCDVLQSLEYDLYYMKNMSPVLDFIVLFRSIRIKKNGPVRPS